MPPPPQISIVLALYNGERFLAPALESALAQTFPDFELIVVDDGSFDRSSAVLDAYQHDPRIRVIRQDNRGPAGALQTGLRHARGEYIAFLDQDDLWDPAYLAAQRDLLRSDPAMDLAFCWFQVIDENGHTTGLRSQRVRGRLNFADLFEDFSIGGTSNLMAKRTALELAGGVDPNFRFFYNVDLCLRIALLGPGNIAALPQSLMYYRRHGGQLSRDFTNLSAEWNRLVDTLAKRAPELVAAHKGRADSNHYRYVARLAYEAEDFPRAIAFLTPGFQSAPAAFLLDPRNWITAVACVIGISLPRPLRLTIERLAGYGRSLPVPEPAATPTQAPSD